MLTRRKTINQGCRLLSRYQHVKVEPWEFKTNHFKIDAYHKLAWSLALCDKCVEQCNEKDQLSTTEIALASVMHFFRSPSNNYTTLHHVTHH